MKYYLVPLHKMSLEDYQSREFPCEQHAIECWQAAQILPKIAFVIQCAKNPKQAAELVHFERCGVCGDHDDYEINLKTDIIELPGVYLDYIERSDDCILH